MFETKEYVPVNIEKFQQSINKWNIDDWQLWEFFRKKYRDNPIDYFDRINEIKLNTLRVFLIKRGVWIQQEISAATALTNTFKEKEFQSIQQHHQLQKISPPARLKISKPSTTASAPPAARSEISTSSTSRPAPSEIPKPSTSVSTPFPARKPAPQTPFSSVQQTPSQPTPSNPPQSPQPPIEPTSQQPSARTSLTSSYTTASLIYPKTLQRQPSIQPTSLRAATSFTTLIITSNCISYKKGMN